VFVLAAGSVIGAFVQKNILTTLAAVALGLSSLGQAQAALIASTFNNTNCGGVTLNSITTLTDQNTNLLGGSVYNASQCIGFIGYGEKRDKVQFNDGPWHVSGTTNIGYLGDGMLNGQAVNGKQYFDGSEFITVPDDLQALKKPNEKVDPGWIHLLSFDPVRNPVYDYSIAGLGLANQIDISSLLTFSLDCDGVLADCKAGSWKLETKPDTIADVVKLLGPATFDHLAFSIKAANSFVVYDFNFKSIFAAEQAEGNNSLNFNTPYILSGRFDTSFDLAGKGVSHMHVLARDPQDFNQVSTPASFTLFGLVLLLMLNTRRAKI